MFGIHANYLIAEVEFFEGEDPEEPLDDEQHLEQQEVRTYILSYTYFLISLISNILKMLNQVLGQKARLDNN